MRVSNIVSAFAGPVLLATGAWSAVTLNLYQDNNCQDPVPGSGSTTVNSDSCDTNPSTGWSSAKITNNEGVGNGTVTFYTEDSCRAGPASKGFSSNDMGCLKDYGFVANAVGFLNIPS